MKTQVDVTVKGKIYKACVINKVAKLTFSDEIHRQFAQLDEQIVDALKDKPACFDRLVLRYQAGGECAKRGVSVTRDRLARQQCVDAVDVQSKLVNRWIDALEKVTIQITQVKSFSHNALQGLFHHLLDNKGQPVCVRTMQNWVGGSNIDNAVYIPPPVEYLPELLEDLSQFMNRKDIPASLQAAIVYAQFTSIHPLKDGNGRFSRALANGILKRRLNLAVAPPVCLYLMAAGYGDYKATLAQYQNNDKQGFILMWQQAIQWALTQQASMHNTLQKVEQTIQGLKFAGQQAQIYSVLIEHPVFSLSVLKNKVSLSASRIAAMLNALENAGVSKSYPVPKGEKQRLWCIPAILASLKQFDQESFVSLKQNKGLHNLRAFPTQPKVHPLLRQTNSAPAVEILRPFGRYAHG